ncbi:hypothetical protein A3D36_01310 [Candidatus Nomurabacteria bacterium RIFCSPHIGHO2_02_FULL_36_29]|uniref:Uncharacterized protein n=1 Tax=Candidatus Nomurabacteria bacterium RIFCSPLOWO2_01_FULL_36_16 TaxID=1801767 RepID=A0A1F6WXM9_9BACT|nr:MAG: hypothetical protein A3D36_01310 [Candidatus Nomurabacteria bacterium RIFCSPHIGHO2_02_FULL_36_29]OGI86632.1 MAG: hypothetical protein A3A91_02875 [Candidatus Nomurabacteria bacterium RIFCSPLOWO2_01_FULL_36_16]
MWRIGLSLFLTTLFKVGTLISNRWLPREYALVDSCHHSIATALFSDSVIKLGDTGKKCLKEFGHRFIADWLGDGMESNAVGCEDFSYGEVVIGISRKPIYTQNNKGLDLIFILTTKLKSFEKFLSVIET